TGGGRLAVVLLQLLIFYSPVALSEEAALSKEAEKSSEKLTKHRFSAPHLGTMVHLVFYDEGRDHAAELAKKCFQRVKDLDAILSDYRADSELNQLCAKPIGVPHPVSRDLFTVISFAQSVSAKSDGAFDITLGKETKRWRRDSKNKSLSTEGKSEASYRDLVLDAAGKKITLNKPLKIDLGGIGKGYIADQLMVVLKTAGIQHAAVIIGGETLLAAAPPGKKGWRIGVENPSREVVGRLVLEHTALSTSGDSYQFFEANGERHAHVIDPSNKKSKTNRLNVTVMAVSSMQADCWATALRVLPTEQAAKLADQVPKLEALFIPFKKKPVKTKNFPCLENG
ncbi:MAG: FAD:protein FMN transferase, partial [Akkermansiaceae bacterium]